MARIQSTWPHRKIAIALIGLGLAIPLYRYFVRPSGAFFSHPEATEPIRLRFQTEFEAFMSELKQSDESMQEASKHR